MRTALVYNFLIEANLMASIAILLMIPIRLFCRKPLGSRAIYAAWLLVAIRLLVPLALPNPLMHEIRSSFSEDMAIRPIAGQLQVRFGDAVSHMRDRANLMGVGAGIARELDELVEDTHNGMLSMNLMKLYLAGAGLVVGWFVISNARFRRQLFKDRIEPLTGRAQQRYEALCQEMGVRRPIPVYYVDPLPSACLVGCLRPAIALPLTIGPQALDNVLRHELCHYLNRDHWWCVVRLVCCAVHWFNPLVWLAARMCRTDGELACDERVISPMDEQARRDYASVLALAACRRELPGVAVMGMSVTGKRLIRRVDGIVHNHQAHRGLALGFVLMASMALVGAFATAETPLLSAIPDGQKMAFRASTAASSILVVSDEDRDATIQTAIQFWQNEALQADLHAELEWSVQAYDTHTEVHAFDPNWGEALVLAFGQDGRILYMNNRASGDREAVAYDDRSNELSEAEMLKVKEYLFAVLEGMEPGVTARMNDLENLGRSRYYDNYFYRFIAYEGEHDEEHEIYAMAVQVYPKVRLTWFENRTDLPAEVSDRLEPGNG